jgi:PAS domain S-box-containing protein
MAQEQIRQREQQLNDSQSLTQVGSWEADLATGTMTASEGLYQLLGREPGSMGSDVLTFWSVVHPDDRDRYRVAFAQACEAAGPVSVDYRITRPDGSELWVQSRLEVVTRADGVGVRVRGTSQDVTERHHAELERQQSDERIRSLVEASPLAIIEYDRDGAVRFWNPAAQRLYGWTSGDVEGRHPPFTASEGAVTFNELFQRVLAGDQVHNVVRNRRRKDGQAVQVSVSMAPLRGPGGDVVGVSSAGLDITHQRQLENDLRQAQKMELIGRLAGGISHEFNNILTVVMGQGEMLLAEVDPHGSVAARVQAIQDAARRAAEFTDQLLTFSRRQVMTGAPADLNSVVSAMQPVLDRMIGGHIELDLRLCAGELVVAADVAQLQQVVLNLVVNACEAMTQGGRITITTATAVALSGPTTAILRVADTGVGMDESTRAHVFEPFFTTKEAGEGTGLGLSAVYGMVGQHGGDVHAASLPDAGSVFTVSLPLTAAAGRAMNPPPAPEPGSRATGTVLLVEDEAMVRELAREVLELQGHVVLEAADGAEALRVADAHGGAIDVLLTDVVLPQIPGPELADRLVAARPDLRVIFMSGYPERHLASIEGHRAVFLAKPFRPADLAAGVAAEISRRCLRPAG